MKPETPVRDGEPAWQLNEINEIINKWGLREEDYRDLEETLGRPFTHLD